MIICIFKIISKKQYLKLSNLSKVTQLNLCIIPLKSFCSSSNPFLEFPKHFFFPLAHFHTVTLWSFTILCFLAANLLINSTSLNSPSCSQIFSLLKDSTGCFLEQYCLIKKLFKSFSSINVFHELVINSGISLIYCNVYILIHRHSLINSHTK